MNQLISTKILYAVTLLLLSLCSTEAFYSIQREGGKVTWTFQETPPLRYHERLALAAQRLRPNSLASHLLLNGAVTEDILQLLRGLQHFQNKILTSTQPLGESSRMNVLNGKSYRGDDVGEEMLMSSMKLSLDNLAQTGEVNSRCANDTGFLLVNMFERQGWALKFLDATAKPGSGLSDLRWNFVGDYDLCRKQVSNGSETTFRGNYVTWRVPLGPVNPINPGSALMIQLGVCMPDSCTDTENTIFLLEALELAGLNGTLDPLPAESHTEVREATDATMIAIIVICVLGTLMFAGTVYDVVFLQWPIWKRKWLIEEEKRDRSKATSNGIDVAADLTRKTDDDDDPLIIDADIQEASSSPKENLNTCKLVKALVAFSVYSNGSKVLNTAQAPGSITCIHGIRFLSMTWVILGHLFIFCLGFTDNTFTELPMFIQRWTFDAVSNALVSVDSFFTLSGLLVSYLTVSEMKKKGWKLNWGLFYFHRFWRLTPPYMLVILLVLGLQQYCGHGPLWPSVQPADKTFCEDNWWTNLFYVNNFVHTESLCLAQSWYLANDMQFYIVSPLLIIPFYFNKVLGFASCGIFFLTHVITTGALSAHHKWGSTFITATASPDVLSFFQDYYVAPWCRIGPYIVGIVTGYLLASHRDRLKFNWLTATIGWTMATAVALAVLYGIHRDIEGNHPSSLGVAALYNALARSAWGACLCWVIVACVAGWGGFVNTFLSWSPFVVLGRLTYMAFLIHINLIDVYFGNQQTLFHLTALNISLNFMGLLVAIYGISFILMLALESPMVGLEKAFLPQRRKE